MTLRSTLEPLLFSFGFRKCNKHEIDFLKIDTDEYLVLRYFTKGVIADLLHEKYSHGENPCTGNPYRDNLIKRDFSEDKLSRQILREFLSNKTK